MAFGVKKNEAPDPVDLSLFGADAVTALRADRCALDRAAWASSRRRPQLPSPPIISNSAAEDKESVAYVGRK
jgi:hypothetical protein